MKRKIISNLEGQRFGRLTVVSYFGKKGKENRKYWICKCSCGKEGHMVSQANLIKKLVKSCGCSKVEMMGKLNLTHGFKSSGSSGKNFYSIWNGMKNRCFNKNIKCYKNYGGRGILVSKRWLKFENFRDDMYQGYKEHVEKHGKGDGTSIERIDNNKGYSKKNCRWATRIEQNNNTRRSIKNYK